MHVMFSFVLHSRKGKQFVSGLCWNNPLKAFGIKVEGKSFTWHMTQKILLSTLKGLFIRVFSFIIQNTDWPILVVEDYPKVSSETNFFIIFWPKLSKLKRPIFFQFKLKLLKIVDKRCTILSNELKFYHFRKLKWLLASDYEWCSVEETVILWLDHN